MKRKQQPARPYRKILLVLGIILLLICGAISFFGYVGLRMLSEFEGWDPSETLSCLGSWQQDNLANVETMARLKLPPSATNLFADSIAWQDCTVFVKFEMAATDIDTFLTSTYVTELHEVHGSNLINFMNKSDPVDWVFEAETVYLHGRGNNQSQEYQEIVIEPVSPARWIVYVVTTLL